jgi:hypothetical protein
MAPLNPTSADPLHDLDLASYALVTSHCGRLGPMGSAYPQAPWDRTRHGTGYPDMPWEPKEAFRTVASHYPQAAGASLSRNAGPRVTSRRSLHDHRCLPRRPAWPLDVS